LAFPDDANSSALLAEAAKELNEKRERWLNPPEWIEQVAAKVDAADRFDDVPEAARPLIRQSAIMAAAAKDDRLKKRTLTNLYNERPTWLKLAHEALDRAVLAAYAAVDPAPSTPSTPSTGSGQAGSGQALSTGSGQAPSTGSGQAPSTGSGQAGNWSEDWAAVWVDSGAGQKLKADHPLVSERARVDQMVLGNLLRLNHARAREPS
jgi:hypothetical protein